MNKTPGNEDLRVFTVVARKSSFAAAAAELGVSAAYVTKRIRILEETLSTKLLHRTTRRVVVTEEGERVYHWAQRVLDDIDHLLQEVSVTRRVPRGLLRVSSSFGFGRNLVAPAISQLVERFPTLAVRLEVFDRLVDVASEGFDLDVRVGDEIAPHLIARRLASNHRVGRRPLAAHRPARADPARSSSGGQCVGGLSVAPEHLGQGARLRRISRGSFQAHRPRHLAGRVRPRGRGVDEMIPACRGPLSAPRSRLRP